MLGDDAFLAEDMVPTARIALAASDEVSDRQHPESRSFINSVRVAILLLLATADTKNLAGFAMVAAIFGASQEALTRFADRKARDLGTSGTNGP